MIPLKSKQNLSELKDGFELVSELARYTYNAATPEGFYHEAPLKMIRDALPYASPSCIRRASRFERDRKAIRSSSC